MDDTHLYIKSIYKSIEFKYLKSEDIYLNKFTIFHSKLQYIQFHSLRYESGKGNTF